MTSTVPGSQSWLLLGITTRYCYITNHNDEHNGEDENYVSDNAWRDILFSSDDIANNPRNNTYQTKCGIHVLHLDCHQYATAEDRTVISHCLHSFRCEILHRDHT